MKPGPKLPVANVEDDEVTVVEEAAEEFNFARFEGPDRCLKKLVDSFDRRAFEGACAGDWRALDGGARFLLEFDDVLYLMESWRDMRGDEEQNCNFFQSLEKVKKIPLKKSMISRILQLTGEQITALIQRTNEANRLLFIL